MDLRQTSPDDRYAVDAIVTGASYSHVHLDWLDPVNLAGREPFLIASQDNRPIGVLGCPPDIPGVTWIRVFGASEDQLEITWQSLWNEAVVNLIAKDVQRVAALALEEWFAEILEAAGFVRSNAVIFYELELNAANVIEGSSAEIVQPIRTGDAELVLKLDRKAFEPLWQISDESLSTAMIQASSASFIEKDGVAVGYQITTTSPFGAHLARLAVHPSRQREGLGSALVNDAIESVRKYGLDLLTVNTQENNASSRRLYEKFGFELTGREYPVYEIGL